MLRYIITFTAIILLPLLQNSKVWGQESTDSLANSIRGVVLDSSTGLPIEGAQVLNSKDASTFSDEDGKFTLQVESFKDIITISA
ncbi:MAG: hypothetical protein PF444_08025 [Bacteroidales bacterium]|jgi:hypothetical protein|nr:hypothetical protein [Bacteroidales bacterium]